MSAKIAGLLAAALTLTAAHAGEKLAAQKPGAEKTAPLLDYDRVCQAFGEGFTNVPGTDVCMRIGGYVKMGTSVGSSAFKPDALPPMTLHLPK
jgi:hypothetical protein